MERIRETSDVLGVMSGSSMDGLDIACIRLHTEIVDGRLSSATYDLLKGTTVSIDETMLAQLRKAHELSAVDLLELDQRFGLWAGQVINQALNEWNTTPSLLAFHGHTVFHFPEKGVSYQLGSGAALSLRTNLAVVNDFRTQDLLLGGQGAPMVAIAEKWLWPDYSQFINLGGICNISIRNDQGVFHSSDLWVCNQILNHLAHELNCPYDDGGKMAAGGQIIPELVEELLTSDWFGKPFPKSLDNSYLPQEVLPVFEKYSKYPTADRLRSAVEVIAISIANQLQENGHNEGNNKEVMVTGGGAFNTFLIDRIQSRINAKIKLPEGNIIHYKEAIMIGFAGWLRYKGISNFLKEATGAAENAIGGVVNVPVKYRWAELK